MYKEAEETDDLSLLSLFLLSIYIITSGMNGVDYNDDYDKKEDEAIPHH